MMQISSVIACTSLIALAQGSVVSLQPEDAYLLTPTFSSNDTSSYNNWAGTTTTTNETLNGIFEEAANASVIIYDPEFFSTISSNATFNLIEQRTDAFAAEGGAWASDRNEVWFSSGVEGETATSISILNLCNNSISTPVFTGDPIPNPNGAYYFNNTIYFTTAGNATHAGGIIAINPATKVVTTVVNSYYGLRFNYIDDMAWLQKNGNSYLFFTDLGAPALTGTFPALTNNPAELLQNAVWRFDPQRKSLRPVIPRSDAAIPNGVRVNAEGTKLYVTDSSMSGLSGVANSSFGSGAIYEWELNDNALPVQKSLFSLTRNGLSDGLKIDDSGNVWTADYSGIWIQAPDGKILANIPAVPLLVDGIKSSFPIQNFALAGDTLVVFAQLRVWTMQLSKQIVAPGNLS